MVSASTDGWFPRSFVLTDIVDSVSLWERDAELMSEVVARHDTIVGREVGVAGGVLVRSKGEGDSSFSVFAHPAAAVAAAMAIQRALGAETWPRAVPLQVRAGVHTGDAEPRDGDWYGPAVNRAARLRALAEGGQVFVSGVTAGLVADRMPEGVRLLYRGRRSLRGIERPEEVWELVAADDPRLVTAGGLPSQELPPALELLADASSFVGRGHERERLRGLWQRARAGHWLMALVTGEAGMGKSRLVAELAAEAQRDGGRVMLGSCFEDLGVPYEPFVQALTTDVAGLADAEVRRRVGTHGRTLAGLVPELLPLLGGGVPGVAAGGVADRAEVYAALADYLSRAAEGSPLLFVVEDLHWSTPTTRHALRHLARSGRPAPILVVVTARDTPPDLDQILAAFLGDLARHPSVETVALSGLAESEIRDLLSGVRADVDPVGVRAATGGNPLFALELATGGHRGPTSLASMLATRCQRLAPRDLEVLDLAAVMGSEFDARLLAAADTTDLTEVLEALERAEAAGVVAASPGQPGRFSFVHALFRSIRYDGLPASRQLALHRRVVEALRPRAHDERVLPELARHACIAAPLGEARTALDYARRAGEMAERLLAMDEAAFHYRAALEMDDLVDPPDPRRRLRLRIALGTALLYAGDPEGRRTLLASARDARTLPDPDALTAVAVAFAWHVMGATASVESADAEVVSVFEAALDATGSEPSAPRARLLAGLSAELVFTDPDRSRRLVTDAVAMARSLDDLRTLGQTLLTHRYVYREPGRSDAGTSIYEELIALGRRLEQPVFTTAGLAELLYAHREVGDLERAAEIELELAEALGDRPLVMPRLYLTTCRAAGRFLAGDLAGAQRLAKEALPLALEAGFQPAVWYGPPRIALRYQQGRIAEMIPDLRDVAFSSVGYSAYAAAVLATALARTGRRDDAADVLAPLATRGFDVFRAQNWLTGTVDLVDAVELLGDRAAAALLRDRLAPFQGRIAGSNFSISRPVDQALCQLALTLDDLDGATATAQRAIAASRRRRTPIFLGRELILFAAARIRAGDTGGGGRHPCRRGPPDSRGNRRPPHRSRSRALRPDLSRGGEGATRN